MAKNVELLDFYADWCGPCKVMGPIIAEIEKEYGDKLKVTKYNVDQAQDEASKYNVMSIPTLLILKDGKVVNQLIGAQPKAAITKAIDEAL